MSYGPGPDFYKKIESYEMDPSFRGKEILIVEDERLLCWSISRNLTRDPEYATACVESGVEALRFIEKYHFDFVILDNRLPGLSGLEVLSRMKQRGISLPVIMISASNDPDLEEDACKAGALLLLRKPFKLIDLKMLISKYLDSPGKPKEVSRNPEIGEPFREENNHL